MVSGELGRGPSGAGAAVAGPGIVAVARCRAGAAAALRVPLPARQRLCNNDGLWEAGLCQALAEGQQLPAQVGAFSVVPSPPVPSRGAGRAGAACGAGAASAALSPLGVRRGSGAGVLGQEESRAKGSRA